MTGRARAAGRSAAPRAKARSAAKARSTAKARSAGKARSAANATPRAKARSAGNAPRRWSQEVTRKSNALDLEPGVFTLADPREIAQSLRRSAERSRRRKAPAFQSAMSMLDFYVNRAGRNLDPRRRSILDQAKDELRRLYGR